MKWFKRILIAFFVLIGILLLIPYLIPLSERPSPDKGDPPFPGSAFAEVDGVTYHHRVITPDSTVLGNIALIHGFSGSTFSWRKVTDPLVAAGYRVVLVDLPGFGYSERARDANLSVSANAERIWRLLGTIDEAPWYITGHSMGSFVAGGMAALRAERTAGLIMVDGAFLGAERSGIFGHMWRPLLSSDPIERAAEVIGDRFFFNYSRIEGLLGSAYGEKPDSQAVKGYLRPLSLEFTASTIVHSASSPELYDLGVGDIQCPVLLLWGDADSWVPREMGEEFLLEHEGSSVLKLIEGAGHCPMETHPKKTLERFKDFLSRNNTKGLDGYR